VASRAETSRHPPAGNAAATRAEPGGAPGLKHRGARGGNAAPSRAETSRLSGPKRTAPPRRKRATLPGANAAIIARWAVTLQVSGAAGGMCSKPADAERAPGGRPASAPQTDAPLSPGRGSRPWAGGRATRQPGRRGRPPRLFPDHKFRDRKYLLAALETAIIHSLTCQLLERDQRLLLNGWHIPSRPGLGPRHPPSCTAGADGGRCICISAGQKAEDARAPGRGRTDTGDPFRGPASSFGLRGLGNDTSAEPDYSRPAYGVEKDPLRCIYSILRS